ncbi:MAG: leucyl/phenylalanyl-tRNA--protein transferase [Gammaproteobacteria bacterium]|nr:leucyl/phenylalanyl-tRNA--protein transferase [Gammaproteobacteria bacterium]
MTAPYWLNPRDASYEFPPVELALSEPNGLLAIGGDLKPERIIKAYQHGIFPWFSEDQPILWWSPNPRAVLFPEQLRVARSLRKTIKKEIYSITLDQAFNDVIHACAAPRNANNGTWITPQMINAYCELHRRGLAHSVEAWQNGKLAGGLYGIALGKVFFGESMFNRATDASKVAFVYLVTQLQRWGFHVIDCQVTTSHLISLGATEIDRQRFVELLAYATTLPAISGHWRFDPDHRPLSGTLRHE